jgi:hypothetical protein
MKCRLDLLVAIGVKWFPGGLVLLVALLISACGGDSSTGTSGSGNLSEFTTDAAGNVGAGVVPPNDGNWQGTWARQTLLAAEDNASDFHQSFYLPSIHYLDDEGLSYGIQFEECMVSPISSVAGELPDSWNFFLTYPGVREFLSQNGAIGNLIYPVAFPANNIDVLGEQHFVYRDPVLAPYGLDIRKVSANFLTNSIWLVDAPGAQLEQYLGCANLFWERESDRSQTVSSLHLGIPLNLADGQLGAIAAEFTFVGTRRVDQIQDNGIFTGPYQVLDEATLRAATSAEFDDGIVYRIDRLGVSVELLSGNRLLITMTGEEDDIPISIRGIVYANPGDWYQTLKPSEVRAATDLSFSGAREDRDGDGYADRWDDFPDDPLERADNDNDGIGDNADPTMTARRMNWIRIHDSHTLASIAMGTAFPINGMTMSMVMGSTMKTICSRATPLKPLIPILTALVTTLIPMTMVTASPIAKTWSRWTRDAAAKLMHCVVNVWLTCCRRLSTLYRLVIPYMPCWATNRRCFHCDWTREPRWHLCLLIHSLSATPASHRLRTLHHNNACMPGSAPV